MALPGETEGNYKERLTTTIAMPQRDTAIPMPNMPKDIL